MLVTADAVNLDMNRFGIVDCSVLSVSYGT